METVKLIELTDEYAIYKYYPEDKRDSAGIVKFNRVNKERLLIKVSEEDFANLYAGHAWCRIEEYDRNNDFKEDDLIAWG